MRTNVLRPWIVLLIQSLSLSTVFAQGNGDEGYCDRPMSEILNPDESTQQRIADNASHYYLPLLVSYAEPTPLVPALTFGEVRKEDFDLKLDDGRVYHVEQPVMDEDEWSTIIKSGYFYVSKNGKKGRKVKIPSVIVPPRDEENERVANEAHWVAFVDGIRVSEDNPNHVMVSTSFYTNLDIYDWDEDGKDVDGNPREKHPEYKRPFLRVMHLMEVTDKKVKVFDDELNLDRVLASYTVIEDGGITVYSLKEEEDAALRVHESAYDQTASFSETNRFVWKPQGHRYRGTNLLHNPPKIGIYFPGVKYVGKTVPKLVVRFFDETNGLVQYLLDDVDHMGLLIRLHRPEEVNWPSRR